MTRILIGLAGIVVILGLAVALSTNRRAIRLRVVGAAFALQAGIAVLVLYVPWGKSVLAFLSGRSEEHTSELQSLMRISYAVFCLKKKTITNLDTQSIAIILKTLN